MLAVAEAEDLDYVQSKLLPHKLSFHCSPPATPARETPQVDPDESLPTKGAHLSDALPAMGGWQSRPAGSAPRLTTPETAGSRDLFVKYTTLEDRSSSYEQAASVDTEMPDTDEDTDVAPTAASSPPISPTLSTSGNTNNALTTAAEPVKNTMSDMAEASPSQTSSNWSLSPILDSMYTWSASSPPPTRYLRFVKQLDSLYGGCSANGLRNISDIIKLGDSFLRDDAVDFIESLRRGWGREGLWYRPTLKNPTIGSSVVERMLRSIRFANTIEYDSTVDPVRLRMARIFLYHYFEQKRLDL